MIAGGSVPTSDTTPSRPAGHSTRVKLAEHRGKLRGVEELEGERCKRDVERRVGQGQAGGVTDEERRAGPEAGGVEPGGRDRVHVGRDVESNHRAVRTDCVRERGEADARSRAHLQDALVRGDRDEMLPRDAGGALEATFNAFVAATSAVVRGTCVGFGSRHPGDVHAARTS